MFKKYLLLILLQLLSIMTVKVAKCFGLQVDVKNLKKIRNVSNKIGNSRMKAIVTFF